MERHKNIPAEATWNDEDKEWVVAGLTHDAGIKTGLWEHWHVDGHRCGISDYGDATPPFSFKRFHADGTVSREGRGLSDSHLLGTWRWIRSNDPTTERFPTNNDSIWCVELDYTEDKGVYEAQRYYNKAHQEVTMWGDLLPARPASVPARAHYVKRLSSANGVEGWVAGFINGFVGKFIGDYAEWDMTGMPTVKRIYHTETTEIVEDHTYKNGKLSSSKITISPTESTSHYYHYDIDPPVVSNTVSYRNSQQDRREAFYDTTGKLLYSVRNEKVSDLHRRRYYNDVLVFECTPVHVAYYYQHGAILINYSSQGDGTGTWHLYDEAGNVLLTLPESREAELTQYGTWDGFLPKWREYTVRYTKDDWQATIEQFRSTHHANAVEAKINTLPVPAYLEAELTKVHWETVEHAARGAKGLPLAINGVLSEDEDVVAECMNRLWIEIEDHGSVFECTYEVSIILARMLPHYAHRPVIQERLLYYLFDVLCLRGIKKYDRYNDLIAAVEVLLPVILMVAKDPDETKASKAQFLLLEVGHKIPETEVFFIGEWQNVNNTDFRRAYAAFVLAHLYGYTNQHEKLISSYRAAFQTEEVLLVRFVLAIRLVTATREEALDVWLAEIVPVISNPFPVDTDFYRIKPFINTDTDQYALRILQYARAEVLEKNIEPVIDSLPHAYSMKQESLLRAIFSALFKTEDARKNITPIRKKALLAAAEVAAQHSTLANHSVIFHEFGLPHDAYKLRQLAAQALS